MHSGKFPKEYRHRNATGHIDPHYASALRAESAERLIDPDPRGFLGKAEDLDAAADQFAEQFVEAVTTGQSDLADFEDRGGEELTGVFVETTAPSALESELAEPLAR